MKFQELATLTEQFYEPNMGVPTVPGVDPLKDIEYQGAVNIGSLVNHLVNPIQVAIDSYNMGTSITDAYSQYQSNPTPGNALGFLALAGLALITLKGGLGGEANEVRALINDIAAQRSEIAKVASAVELGEKLPKLFTPSNTRELAAMNNMSEKRLASMFKVAFPEAKAAAKEVKDVVKSEPELKTAYKAAIDRHEALLKGAGKETATTASPSTPLRTAAQVADDNFTKTALATPASKINWEMPPWNSMGEKINAELAKLPKTELRGAKLGEYFKARPEIDSIAKQNNITPEQVKSYIDYSYTLPTPVATPGAGSIPLPAPTTPAPTTSIPATPTSTAPAATTKLVSRPPIPGAVRTRTTAPLTLRPTTPAQRAANTKLSKIMTAPQVTELISSPEVKNLVKQPTETKKGILRSLYSISKGLYDKLGPEEKLGVTSLVAGIPLALLGTAGGSLIAGKVDELTPLRQEFANWLRSSDGIGPLFKDNINTEIDKNINRLNEKKTKLTQSLSTAGWRPEQIQRMVSSIDEQIKRAQTLKAQ